MSKRSILVGVALTATLGACSRMQQEVAYTTPGWYLERPRFVVAAGPEIFGGPFTYDQCEAERMKVERSDRLLCIQEKIKPGPLGPDSKSVK